jgi:hypothetical protein
MKNSEVYVLAIFAFTILFMLVFGTRHSTFQESIENCIQANSDWTVATAKTYCSSVIREGKRP